MESSTEQLQAAPSNSTPASPPPLLGLPSETLRAILSYAKPSDLVSLCRVSKAIRDIAVSLLYRSLSHEFTELKSGEPAVDRLAGILETLVTSDFNYASFIKEIDLGATYVADATMTKEFHYGNSCGKFFNTLLLSTLKKVSTLENFRWDIRVEMSPSMFAILGKLSSLHHLHLRMHAGQSLSSSTLQVVVNPNPPPVPTSHHHHHHNPPPVTPAAGLHFGSPGAGAVGGGGVSLVERHEVHKFEDSQRTFSRFQHLESLSVLEMDTLEYIPEITQCISLSSGSLKNLKLSFSEGLALKARNKPTTTTSDTDSTMPEEEDEWYEPDDFAPAAAASAGPSNDPDTRRERMEQEKVLSTIFGSLKDTKTNNNPDSLERFVADAIASANKKSLASTRSEVGISADHFFVKELRSVTHELRQKHASHGKSRSKSLKAIETLQRAANVYLERCAFAQSNTVADENATETTPTAGSKADNEPFSDHMAAGPSTIQPQGDSSQSTSPATEKAESTVLSPNHADFDSGNESQKYNILDIVDMEHPDDDGDEGEDQEFLEPEDVPAETSVCKPTVETGKNDLDKSAAGKGASNKGKEPVRESNNSDDHNTEAGGPNGTCNGNNHASDREVQEYIRSRHGLPLENLSIYLIPVKPSVICRAVNIWALRHISLLNVGAQRAFWATLGKLHESNPLQISSIHTDNVSSVFLDFVSDLDCVKELFMFERNSRCAVKSLAPKTTVSIEEITKKVLGKHIRHLERLMIRNDEDTSWSLNKESIRMITRRGSSLKELVVALKSANFHTMIQDIADLKSLAVFHILFSSSDNCPSVLREIRSCAIDHVVPLPSLKIKYIAVSYGAKEPHSTTVSQIHRKFRQTPRSRRFSGSNISDSSSVVASQGNASEQNKANGGPNATPSVVLSQHEDDLDSLYVDKSTFSEGLKIEDIKDVRVWEKEIWHLRM